MTVINNNDWDPNWKNKSGQYQDGVKGASIRVDSYGQLVIDNFDGPVYIKSDGDMTLLSGGHLTLEQKTGKNVYIGGDGIYVYQKEIRGSLAVAGSLYRSSQVGLQSGGWLSIGFNAERRDPYGQHNNTIYNSRVTVGLRQGLYLVTASVAFDTNYTGHRALRLIKNGSEIFAHVGQDACSANWTVLNITGLIYCPNVSDYFEVQGYQDSGSALDLPYYNYGVPTLQWTKIV